MGKIRTIELTVEQEKGLQEGYQLGETHAFRRRCQLILLKSEGRTSKEVSQIIKMNEISINNWLDRYQSEGIKGLMTKPGRGRKKVLDQIQDAAKVRQAVQKERQRLAQAKIILEKELNKQFSLKTLKRFLKNLTADTKE
ncbi:MAG TPA: helix-turn-helix domain-containing protein [Phormidium sp.]